MIEITIRQKDIDALRDKLKIGDHVTYQTEVIDDRPGWTQRKDNKAVVIAKYPHVVLVEYMVRRGREWVPVRGTVTYQDIFLQRARKSK